MLTYVFLFFVSFGTAGCLTALLRVIARKVEGFGHHGDGSSIPVSPLGGIAIFIATFLTYPLFLSSFPPGLWIGALGMTLVGWADDWWDFSPVQKLILQTVVVVLAVGSGLCLEVTGSAVLDGLLTGIWLIWICNAFNVLDMEDGLAAGVGALSALGLGFLGLLGESPPLFGLALTFVGGFGGFLIHNFHPARIYMGDNGSLFSGFLLGAMAIEVSRLLPFPQGVLCPLIVLGIPSFEGAFLCLVRTSKRQPIMQASQDHVVQRLEWIGYSIRRAVGWVYVVCSLLALLGIIGVVGATQVCWTIFGITLIIAVSFGVGLGRVDMENRRVKRPNLFSKNWVVDRLMWKSMTRVANKAKGILLDVGCGEIPYFEIFESRVQRYVGLERDRIRYRDRPMDLCGDAIALPFGPETFDTVICNQVLEHLSEPNLAMEEIARVLVPGGYLILTAPHIWGIHEEPRDFYRFTNFGLCYLAERAQLEVLEIQAMAGFWVTAGVRFCYYLEHFDWGPFKIVVRSLYLLVQTGALLLDRLHLVKGEAWNHLMVARKWDR